VSSPTVAAQARRRGGIAAALLVPALLVVAFLRPPPGVETLILLPAFIVAGHAVAVEWRSRQPDAVPGFGRAMLSVAFLVALPAGYGSLYLATLAYEDPDCPPILGWMDAPPSDLSSDFVARCEATSAGELAGLVTWTAVVVITAALLVAGFWLTKRSRTATWMAIPLAVAGPVIAYDLGHLAAVVMR
jgi:hypothetical protein